MHPTSSVSHESISRRAYEIWEDDGGSEGNETAHWLQAEAELHAKHAQAIPVDGSRGKSVEPPLAGKHAREQAPHSTDYVHPGVTTDSLHHVRR
jgi:hypothetical protein